MTSIIASNILAADEQTDIAGVADHGIVNPRYPGGHGIPTDDCVSKPRSF
jgi:hypothetical protein